MCDLRDFVPPEMDKIRPVVVISPRLSNRGEIVTIVPVSTQEPHAPAKYHVQLSKNYHPREPDQPGMWAKCDMVMNLSRSRLDGFKVGRRRWELPVISAEDLAAVRLGVFYGLGFGLGLVNLKKGPNSTK